MNLVEDTAEIRRAYQSVNWKAEKRVTITYMGISSRPSQIGSLHNDDAALLFCAQDESFPRHQVVYQVLVQKRITVAPEVEDCGLSRLIAPFKEANS